MSQDHKYHTGALTAQHIPAETVQSNQNSTRDNKAEESKGDEHDSDKKQLPVGNGGRTSKYIWTQTWNEVQVNVLIPIGTRARNMKVKIENTKCSISLKDKHLVLEGEFPEKIRAGESIWTMGDSVETPDGRKFMEIIIVKYERKWWDCAFKGHPKIDVTKIKPGQSTDLVELNEDVDRWRDYWPKQRTPSLDEQRKQELLRQFMESHPELDFSKVKFA